MRAEAEAKRKAEEERLRKEEEGEGEGEDEDEGELHPGKSARFHITFCCCFFMGSEMWCRLRIVFENVTPTLVIIIS